jgi:hypothetical protein
MISPNLEVLGDDHFDKLKITSTKIDNLSSLLQDYYKQKNKQAKGSPPTSYHSPKLTFQEESKQRSKSQLRVQMPKLNIKRILNKLNSGTLMRMNKDKKS